MAFREATPAGTMLPPVPTARSSTDDGVAELWTGKDGVRLPVVAAPLVHAQLIPADGNVDDAVGFERHVSVERDALVNADLNHHLPVEHAEGPRRLKERAADDDRFVVELPIGRGGSHLWRRRPKRIGLSPTHSRNDHCHDRDKAEDKRTHFDLHEWHSLNVRATMELLVMADG